MIQINLIPDVKREFLRARRIRNLAISISILAGAAAGALVLVLILSLGVQAGRDALAQNSIDNSYEELKQVEDLSDLVTLQNQLTVISDQHNKKSVDSRMFAVIQAVNPAPPDDSRFTNVNLQPADKKLILEGISASGYPAVEQLKKTIANTKIEYRDAANTSELTSVPLATAINVGETNVAENSEGRRVLQFEITISYADMLFTNTAKSLRIVSPTKKIDVTDSRLRVPESLFAPSTGRE